MVSPAVLATAAVTVVFLFAQRYFSLPVLPNEPLLIPHWMPFFGHAFSFARSKRSFFRWANAKTGGQPFSVPMGGRRHYIFSDPADIAGIHKNGKTLSIRGFVRFIYISIWGFKPADADAMWEIKPEWHRMDIEWLLSDKNDQIAVNYLHRIEEQLCVLDAEVEGAPDKAIVRPGLKTVVDVQGKATCQVLYGATTLEKHPELLDDLTTMVRDGFWGLLFRAPRFLFRNAYEARDRIINTYADLAENIETRKDISPYLYERTVYLTQQGISPRAQGADMLRTMFASLLNSMPTGYLALLHILAEPGLADEVRKELIDCGYLERSPKEMLEILPGKMPLLRSIWHETLRMHNNSLTVREVTADTKFTGKNTWQVQKGGVINIPCGLMHFNEALHPDPESFHARRFMEKDLGGEGESHARTTKPFGGGSTHCPGRVFAEKQMIGLVAALLMRYDMGIVNADWKMPLVSEFDDITKQPTVWVRISKRV
ncbi:cytochrome P450 [Penicillium robsamsonii]|uniref:cytochrome P450 n=1 Tax=Penicillium robsamsonii TaxID=1792511 RepID=UPI0025492B75|nr:cytochrome P450 [Penicillium robsamsonii]KAJ5822472.1 cytochrome P450 [Penicillium robsamsonii]